MSVSRTTERRRRVRLGGLLLPEVVWRHGRFLWSPLHGFRLLMQQVWLSEKQVFFISGWL